MPVTSFLRPCLAMPILGIAILSACTPAPDLARTEPDVIKVDVRGKLSGSYNPTRYRAADVQKLLGNLCNGNQLGGYGEERAGDLVAFTATCTQGQIGDSGYAVIFRRKDGSMRLECVMSDKTGRMFMQRRPVSL